MPPCTRFQISLPYTRWPCTSDCHVSMHHIALQGINILLRKKINNNLSNNILYFSYFATIEAYQCNLENVPYLQGRSPKKREKTLLPRSNRLDRLSYTHFYYSLDPFSSLFLSKLRLILLKHCVTFFSPPKRWRNVYSLL